MRFEIWLWQEDGVKIAESENANEICRLLVTLENALAQLYFGDEMHPHLTVHETVSDSVLAETFLQREHVAAKCSGCGITVLQTFYGNAGWLCKICYDAERKRDRERDLRRIAESNAV